MPRNVYFNQGNTTEKRLHEDLTIEALKIYGHDVFYIPRTIVNTNAVFNEDALSKFAVGQDFIIVPNIEGRPGEETIKWIGSEEGQKELEKVRKQSKR